MDDDLPRLPGIREAALRRRRATVGALADHRRAAGLSQTEVAARMGTSQSTIARLEAGEVDPRMSTLERYAEALGGRLDVTLRFDPAPAFGPDPSHRPAPVPTPPGLPLLRPVVAPTYPVPVTEPVHPYPAPEPGLAPAAHERPTAPGVLRPAAHGDPAQTDPAQVDPASEPVTPAHDDGAGPERPRPAAVPPPGGDRPAHPTRRRW